MNFQTFLNPLGLTLLAGWIITFAAATGYLISNKTHMDTVSWNG